MIDKLQKLSVEIVERFLETRDVKSSGIPEPLADYILQVNEAANLHRKYHSISESARQLQRVYKDLSIATCRKRVFDAITYFNSDCSVTSTAWNNYFADRMMDLGKVQLIAHELDGAYKSWRTARDYRLEAAKDYVDPRRLQFKPQLVSADITLERMGIKPVGILKAYEEAVQIIDSRDIPNAEKERIKTEIKRELNIKAEDVKYEDTEV